MGYEACLLVPGTNFELLSFMEFIVTGRKKMNNLIIIALNM